MKAIHRDKILELRAKGFSYREIQAELGCSKGTIAYHCGNEQKDKTRTRNRQFHGSQHPLYRKINHFCEPESMFAVSELLDKIGDDPRCALTGRPIDLLAARTYHLDHIIPRSRGGTNSLDNCQLVCREANLAKSDMTPDEFILLCQEVVAKARR